MAGGVMGRNLVSRRDRRNVWRRLPLAAVGAAVISLSAAPGAVGDGDDAAVARLAAIEPIDSHLHAYQDVPAVGDLFVRFNLRALNITLIDDRDPFAKSMEPQWTDALAVRRRTKGRASVSTTIDPYDIEKPGFAARVNTRLDADFAAGAIAVKLYKVVGMELKRRDGKYVLPDDSALAPVFENIAAHHKTLVAHVAEPDSCWKAPDPKSPDYSYYTQHPEEYAYQHPEWPKKEAILAARDHLLQLHPNLKVVGAHLGSMEVDVDQIARRFDKYPNFAVDTAARIDYLMMQAPEKVRAFLVKYQDRVIYGTDNVLYPTDKTEIVLREWADRYERDWRYFSGEADVKYDGGTTKGLHLPLDVLRKLYHENAVRWIPGIG
jgi:predicted TIM-barrel fold metal-dependent hydrolase